MGELKDLKPGLFEWRPNSSNTFQTINSLIVQPLAKTSNFARYDLRNF
jgi:hypothetical protein